MIERDIGMTGLAAHLTPIISLAAIALLTLAPPIAAQEPPPPAPQASSKQPAATASEDKTKDLSTHKTQLQGIEDTIEASEAQRRQIEAEIENLRGDRARLAAALIATTQAVSAAETKISEAEARLDSLNGREEAIRRSLASRRTVIAEVLASLQRMGRTPPPALLVAPEDMLQAIRMSMLLGAVVPQMRAETEALASDLADLIELRQSIVAEKAELRSASHRPRRAATKARSAHRCPAGCAWRRRGGACGRARARRQSCRPGYEPEAAPRPHGE